LQNSQDTTFKPANSRAARYAAGWPEGIELNLVASKYTAPARPTAKVPNPPNRNTVLGPAVPAPAAITLFLEHGGLPSVLARRATVDAKQFVTVGGAVDGYSAANGLMCVFAASSGAIRGSFVHPGTGKAVSFAGVVFQKTQSAGGYFYYVPPRGAPAGSVAEIGSITVGLQR
jgi:hypothetical protein